MSSYFIIFGKSQTKLLEETGMIVLSFLCLVLKMKVSLDCLMDSLTSHLDTGDSVAIVENLVKELKSLEKKAQVGSYFLVNATE